MTTPFGFETYHGNDQYGIDPSELHNTVIDSRRRDSEKSLLGIPAESDEYPTTTPTSTSQGSWETISKTSHSPSYSVVDVPQNDDGPAGSQSLHGVALPPHVRFDGPPEPPTQRSSASYTQWIEQQPYMEQQSSFPFSQPIQSRPSVPFVVAPDPSIPDRPFINTSLQGMVTDEQAYSTLGQISMFTPSPYLENLGFLSPTECPPGDIGYSEFSDTGESTSASEFVDPSILSRELASDANLVPRDNNIQLSVRPTARVHKRKHSSPSSQRSNLDEINQVRKRGACVRCRTLHESVSYLSARA